MANNKEKKMACVGVFGWEEDTEEPADGWHDSDQGAVFDNCSIRLGFSQDDSSPFPEDNDY